MSLEQNVAALAVQVNSLLGLPGQVSEAANAGIARMEAAFTVAARNLVSVFVDPLTGSDLAARAGTAVQPLQSIHAAIARVPIGGVGYIFLMGPITLATAVTILGRTVVLTSASSVRHAVNCQRSNINGTTRGLAGFNFEANGQLVINNLTLQMPPLTGFEALAAGSPSALFQTTNELYTSFLTVVILGCDLNLPPVPFGPLIGATGPAVLRLANCVLTGSPLTGRVIAAQPNTTTPVATSAYRWLLTNLTEV